MGISVLLSLFVLFSSASAACERCPHQSKATFFPSSAVSSGACGYGSMAMDFNGGFVAAGGSSVYRDGVGCGSCFQIRCKDANLCRRSGVIVTVTDTNQSNETAFALSKPAFIAMANDGMGQELAMLGTVDIEYKRVPCEYKNKYLSFRVEESSQSNSYLAIMFIYVGGQTDISDVNVGHYMLTSLVDWKPMNKTYGAVWAISQPPEGPLLMRIMLADREEKKWYMNHQLALPARWTAGQVYETNLIVNNVATEFCSPCDKEDWK